MVLANQFIFIFMCVSVVYAICVYVPPMVWLLGTKLRASQEQEVLLSTEPSLQSLCLSF